MSNELELPEVYAGSDLDWTGNHFLDEDLISRILDKELDGFLFTKKGPAFAQPLLEEIARYYQLDPAWVMAGVGSSHILDNLMRFYGNHEVLDVIPNFKMAALSRHRDRQTYRAIPVREPQELFAKVCAAKPAEKSVIILSSPRNPFGYAFSLATIEELARSFPGVVIIDGAYTEFSDIDIVPLIHTYPNLVLVRTFSKAWGIANLRVGYALAPSLGSVFRERYLLPYCLSELQQRVASALLRNPQPMLDSVAKVAVHRRRLITRLRSIEGLHVWDSDANYVCVEHPKADGAIATLARAGISVARLHSLPGYPAEWPDGFRISVCRPSVEDKVIEQLSTLARV